VSRILTPETPSPRWGTLRSELIVVHGLFPFPEYLFRPLQATLLSCCIDEHACRGTFRYNTMLSLRLPNVAPAEQGRPEAAQAMLHVGSAAVADRYGSGRRKAAPQLPWPSCGESRQWL